VDFNALVARELRAYVDRIAEDVASAEAEAELVSGHAEAEGRADAIRALKRQIVEERRAQEALLKRLKEPNQGGATSNANAARPRPAPLSARR
jgi:regulator of protease activity HflC (stomatin/prohibitin superfamily)